MYCNNCGKEIDVNAKFCNNCGATIENTRVIAKKKNIFQQWWFWFLLIIVIILMSGMISRQNKKEVVTSKNSVDKDLSMMIYEDKEFIVKIVNYEYNNITNSIKFNVYIENNSDKDTHFNIDGHVSVNGYMVEGGYFVETVNAKSKANKSFIVRDLEKNGINNSNLKDMKFKFEIYRSENYIITERIVDNLEVTYNF